MIEKPRGEEYMVETSVGEKSKSIWHMYVSEMCVAETFAAKKTSG